MEISILKGGESMTFKTIVINGATVNEMEDIQRKLLNKSIEISDFKFNSAFNTINLTVESELSEEEILYLIGLK